jgi:hypothetical protein
MINAAAHDIDSAQLGRFNGTGTWVDETGQEMEYTVEQSLEVSDEYPVLRFVHEFADGTATRAEFELRTQRHGFFDVVAGGNAIGRGYVDGVLLVYYLDLQGNHVSVRSVPTESGLEIHAYSTRNADGHLIYWREDLKRE